MTGQGLPMRNKSRSSGSVTGGAAGRHLRALIPPITPGLVVRALLGVILFFFGIVFGAWLIFRFRRHSQGSRP